MSALIVPRNPAKQYLQRYRALIARQRSIEREIDRLYESVTGITARLKPDVVTGSGSTDRMADAVASIADAQAVLQDLLREISQELAGIREAIDAVPDEVQKTVLTMRYISGMSWEDIQDAIGYERTQAYVIHGRALVAVNAWLTNRGETE